MNYFNHNIAYHKYQISIHSTGNQLRPKMVCFSNYKTHKFSSADDGGKLLINIDKCLEANDKASKHKF